MTRTAMDTASLNELAAIETDTRFFMRLLVGAGIAAAAVVAGGVVWYASEIGGDAPATMHHEQLQQPEPMRPPGSA